MNKIQGVVAMVSGVVLMVISGLCTAVWFGIEKETEWTDAVQILGLFALVAIVAVAVIIFMGKPWVEGRQEIEKCKECPDKDG